MNSGEIHYRYHFPFHETLVCSKAFPTKKFPHSIKRKFLQRTKSIHDSIKKNSLALFSSPKRKAKSKCVQKIAAERSNTSLFGCLSQMNSVKNVLAFSSSLFPSYLSLTYFLCLIFRLALFFINGVQNLVHTMMGLCIVIIIPNRGSSAHLH